MLYEVITQLFGPTCQMIVQGLRHLDLSQQAIEFFELHSGVGTLTTGACALALPSIGLPSMLLKNANSCVITSYSIHYTKLYERWSPRADPRGATREQLRNNFV